MARPIRPSPRISTTVAVTTAVVVVVLTTVLTVWWRRRKREVRIPEKWRRVGTLSDLILYPLKSGALLLLDEAECTERGLRTTANHEMRLRDRVFVLMGADGNMRTARQHNKLVLIKVTRADEASVTFQAPDAENLTVLLPRPGEAKETWVTMWHKEKVPGLDCGDEAAKWFREVMGLEGVRLVHYDLEALPVRDTSDPRFIPLMGLYRNFRHDDPGAYSDLASYMMINAASVEDLKRRLGDDGPPTLSAHWFRPNFVVSGAEAYAEDTWNFLRIGDSVVVQSNKPCTRCIFTTVNPETGKRTENMQPLKGLRTYRAITNPKQQAVESSNSPLFGINMGLRRPGIIRKGDAVYVPDE